MLRILCVDSRGLLEITPTGEFPEGPWVDLLSPTTEETRFLEAQTGLDVASRDELAEIESSSRLSERDGVVYISIPIVLDRGDGLATSSQIGVVLSEKRLVTIRFGEVPGFKAYVQSLAKQHVHTPAEVFVGFLETLVDRTADQLEHIRDDMDRPANHIFLQHSGAQGPSQDNRALRQALQKVSLTGDYVSRIHDTLLVMGRIAGYVGSLGPAWFPAALQTRMKTLRQGIAALKELQPALSATNQFLLGAILRS